MQVCKYAVQKYTSMQICKYASIQLCKLQVNLRPISGKSYAYRRHTSGRYQTNLSLISSKSQTYIRHFCKFVYNPHERERERERERFILKVICFINTSLSSQQYNPSLYFLISMDYICNFGNYRAYLGHKKCAQCIYICTTLKILCFATLHNTCACLIKQRKINQ